MKTREGRTELYHRYSKASELPLMVLALVMVAVLLVPEVIDLSPQVMDVLETVDWFIYACFAADFLVKIYLAPSITEHIKRNWLDVIILLLPLLRPLRLLQGARLLRLIRAFRLLVFMAEWARKLRGVLAQHGLNMVLLITLALIVLTSGLVALFERDAGGSIKEFGDALWWAVATVTTVGYGDALPVTPEGRGLAVFLMLIGIVFFGILTANIAAYFVGSSESAATKALEEKMDRVLARLDEIETGLKAAGVGSPRETAAASQAEMGMKPALTRKSGR